jgi:putative phosphonate metabolism protein
MILNEKYLATPYRCAVYYVPDLDSPWWRAGSQWLGRCAVTGQAMAQPLLPGVSPLQQWAGTAEPRRYGWHATLKAPFKIMPGENLRTVMSALQALADTLVPFELPPLKVSTSGGFMALRPEGDVTYLDAVAAACVTQLHRFAQPLSELDLARRRLAPLTPEQDRLLMTWGYPYVLSAFEFHLSLTGRMDEMSEDSRWAWQQAAQAHFEHLGVCRFDRLALFVEPERGADFQLHELVALGA